MQDGKGSPLLNEGDIVACNLSGVFPLPGTPERIENVFESSMERFKNLFNRIDKLKYPGYYDGGGSEVLLSSIVDKKSGDKIIKISMNTDYTRFTCKDDETISNDECVRYVPLTLTLDKSGNYRTNYLPNGCAREDTNCGRFGDDYGDHLLSIIEGYIKRCENYRNNVKNKPRFSLVSKFDELYEKLPGYIDSCKKGEKPRICRYDGWDGKFGGGASVNRKCYSICLDVIGWGEVWFNCYFTNGKFGLDSCFILDEDETRSVLNIIEKAIEGDTSIKLEDLPSRFQNDLRKKRTTHYHYNDMEPFS